MGSHYCCRKCGERYDECDCKPLIYSNPRNENNYYEAPVGSAIDEPAPVNPIPDRKAELQGDIVDIEEYIKMVDENEAVENETVGGPEEENQPEEEQGVNHGQDMAGAVPNPVDPDENDDEEFTDESDFDADSDNADTEATDRKGEE